MYLPDPDPAPLTEALLWIQEIRDDQDTFHYMLEGADFSQLISINVRMVLGKSRSVDSPSVHGGGSLPSDPLLSGYCLYAP